MTMTKIVNHILQRRLLRSSTSYYFNIVPIFRYNVLYTTKRFSIKSSNETKENNKIQVNVSEQIKTNAVSAWYLAVIVGGIGVTIVMFYTVFKELFSSTSPTTIYSKALDYCKNDSRVLDILGSPIKAQAEGARRGHRHVYSYDVRGGEKYMNMKFRIQGIRRRGVVHVQVKENKSGKYEFTNLFVTVENIGKILIISSQDKTTLN